jgi:asparagine synthase (glutamine-hydrolysing)
MCGIVGIFSAKGLSGYGSALKAANDIVAYRGPDGAGLVMFDTEFGTGSISKANRVRDDVQTEKMTLAFGHRRLAIIDLTKSGHQPMGNENESVWIVYNGEVYNYVELRAELEKSGHTFYSQSDTEVVLKAYIEWGESCVKRFNGMWAFAIADLREKIVFCSRDRFGIKPFHYFFDGQHFVFGSEIKQLLCFPFVKVKINRKSLYEFLAYGAVGCSEETFFGNIYQLQQGHNLVFHLKDSTLTKTCYYQPKLEINDRITFNMAAEEFRHLLRESVKLRLRSDVEVGSCLSGGLDSSSIVCLVNQLLTKEGRSGIQRTFSLHFHEEEANEYEYMEEVIRSTKVQAHFTYPTPDDLLQDIERLVWHQEEPFGSTSVFGQWSVFKLVHQEGIKVMLDGQGADEQLAGYVDLAFYYLRELHYKREYVRLAVEAWRHARLHRKPWASMLPGRAANIVGRFISFGKKHVPSLVLDWMKPEMTEEYQRQSYYLANQRKKPFGDLEELNNVLYQLTFLNNLQELLKYEDRNSMAFSVESRLPFLDYRLVEFVFSLPSSFKIRGGYTKRILREGMAGVIPEKIRWRKGKLGFATPESLWQRTVLLPLIKQAIEDYRMRAFLVPEKANAYFEQIQKYHITDFSPWRWLNVYLWMQVYDVA